MRNATAISSICNTQNSRQNNRHLPKITMKWSLNRTATFVSAVIAMTDVLSGPRCTNLKLELPETSTYLKALHGYSHVASLWVVPKIRVPFWYPYLLGAVIQSKPKGPTILRTVTLNPKPLRSTTSCLSLCFSKPLGLGSNDCAWSPNAAGSQNLPLR